MAASVSHKKHLTDHITQTLQSDDPDQDPIAAQYIPTDQEAFIAPDEIDDPIGDEAHSTLSGLIHRYPDRVLLKITDNSLISAILTSLWVFSIILAASATFMEEAL